MQDDGRHRGDRAGKGGDREICAHLITRRPSFKNKEPVAARAGKPAVGETTNRVRGLELSTCIKTFCECRL